MNATVLAWTYQESSYLVALVEMIVLTYDYNLESCPLWFVDKKCYR